jgi:hypothetical protein
MLRSTVGMGLVEVAWDGGTMSRNELTRLRVLIDIADGRLSVADATGRHCQLNGVAVSFPAPLG